MRKTVDTNVLVRALVDEGTEQSIQAIACLASDSIYIPVTVLLETEWVLRSSYGLQRETVAGLFGKLLGADNVNVEDAERVGDAILAHGDGMDFADALHLYRSANSDVFVTFDQELIRRAPTLAGTVRVVRPTQQTA